MTEITFDQIEVGDRIKTCEVLKDGSIIEREFTVTNSHSGYATNNYIILKRDFSARTELTITRVAPTEPERIGTVVEYKSDGVTRTAVKFSNAQDVKYQWIREDGYWLTWSEILEDDPSPKIVQG